MRVRSSKKKQVIDKQYIINYQYEMIALSLPLVEPTITNTNKYSPWELEKKIKQTVGQTPSVVRWIGNSETAYLEIYAYILLIGTGHSQANILEFKHTVYKLGKKCLQLAQQKLLVQFLCLIQYSKDRYSFLNKYPQIQAIFIKILQYLQQQHTNSQDSNPQNKAKAKVRRKYIPKARSNDSDKKQFTNGNNSHRSNSLSQQIDYEKQLEQIYQTFNNYFQFIALTNSNEYSCTLQLFQNKKVYVVIEKQCYFMVQTQQPRFEDLHQFTLGNRQKNGMEKHLKRESSSLTNFDKKQFLDIFNEKNQIEESNVIVIERGSQVRKHSTANLLENIANISTPKFTSLVSQHFQCPQEFQIHKNEEKIQNDRTFIDELLNNVALNTEKDHSKSLQNLDRSQTTSKKKKYIEQKMKCIQTIKEQLQLVRLRIQGKIKLIDQAHVNQSGASKKEIKPYSEQEKPMKLKIDQKEFKTNIIKESVVKKFQNALFLKKQRKTSYNSVKIIPDSKGTRRVEQNCQLQSLPQNRGSAKPSMQRVQRMLSQKAVSRPPSGFNQIAFEQHSGFRRKKSPDYQRRNDYNIRSLSPKNVNVNVNVNINENMLHHNAYNQGSYQTSYQQIYKDNRKGQYYSTTNHQIPIFIPKNMENKAKFPPFLQKKRNKVVNSQNSLITMNKTAFTKVH